jgi:hypothetical protein
MEDDLEFGLEMEDNLNKKVHHWDWEDIDKHSKFAVYLSKTNSGIYEISVITHTLFNEIIYRNNR